MKECQNYDAHDAMIIRRFQQQFSLPDDICKDLLLVVKSYLWLSARRLKEEGKFIPMLESHYAVDEMWHTFILFTREYTDFSLYLAGKYLHHSPSEQGSAIPLSEMRDCIAYIAQYLDEDLLRKWFLEWPESLSKERLFKSYWCYTLPPAEH